MAESWAADVRKYVPDANEKAIAGIVKYCGIALQKRDSSLVSSMLFMGAAGWLCIIVHLRHLKGGGVFCLRGLPQTRQPGRILRHRFLGEPEDRQARS